MFSIYGTSGRLFSGPLEQLRRVRRSEATARVDALGDRELDFLPAPERAGGEAAATVAAHTGGHAAAAGPLAAYAQAGGGSDRHRLTRVDELMSRPAVVLAAELPLRAAWHELVQHQVGQAPVLDAEGRLVGLLRQADLALPPPETETLPGIAAQALLLAHWAQPVAARMRTPVPAVAPDADVRRVAQVLLELALPGLPVVDEAGAVLGFVSRSDILRAVTHEPPLDLWA